jgi:hypothetical protein
VLEFPLYEQALAATHKAFKVSLPVGWIVVVCVKQYKIEIKNNK